MKALILALSLIVALNPAPLVGAEKAGGGINPALLYYQALLIRPDVPGSEVKLLQSTDWLGRPLDDEIKEALAGHDSPFRMMIQAMRSKAPCDWGLDLSQGPDLLLPALSRVKGLAQVGRLRVRWLLEEGREQQACDELMAVWAMGRNMGHGEVLICALVGYAIEQIATTTVAENFAAFSPESLKHLRTQIATLPARTTISECILTGEGALIEWTLRAIDQAAMEGRGNERKAVQWFQHKIAGAFGSEGDSGKSVDSAASRFVEYSGRTLDGMRLKLEEVRTLQHQLAEAGRLPHPRYIEAVAQFNKAVTEHENPMVGVFIPALTKSHKRQLNIEVRSAMVLAAIARRVEGDAVSRSIPDPAGDGSFAAEPLQIEGREQGFLLKSVMENEHSQLSMAFPTARGVAVQVDGPNVGKPAGAGKGASR